MTHLMAQSPPDETSALARAEQNLALLQTQVDTLYGEAQSFRRRIEHLHSDREALRSRAFELETALHALRRRRGYRLRRLLSDLVHGRVPLREIRKRVSTLRAVPASPAPPPPPGPAFRDVATEHSTLIPSISLPPPRPRRADLRVAAVMDDFSRTAFSYEFDYVPITPNRWREELAQPPDLLLVESAFGGNKGEWVNQIAGFCPPRQAVAELTAWCSSEAIPTVFWNKEDPVNFEWFIGAASAFDWVFTVDSDSIPRYREELGHNRVASLPFAAQPAINFPPVSDDQRTGDVAFAGSYYARKHPERRRQMDMILEPALDFDLDIFDRMGNLDDPRFAWPDRYRSHLRGSLSYAQTTEAYRRYKVFLNINTVTDSPTMCARRVFELLASGTAVISGPARALDEMVPAEAIVVSNSRSETAAHLERLLASPETRTSLGTAGRAWVAAGNTYADRVATILETVGLS